MSDHLNVRAHLTVGAVWKRKATGALVRITQLQDQTSSWNPNPYYDIAWETVEKPTRRGQSFEEYWLKNCEPAAQVEGECQPNERGAAT